MSKSIKKAAGNKASWQITLFASPFVLLGLAALMLAFYPVVQHLRSQNWQQVSGQTISIDDVSGDRTTGLSRNEDVSRMEGAFSYQWQGRIHRSTQIYFGLMRDNFDDEWHEMVSARLGSPGQAIQVWVNPAHPEEAVAIRDIRWLEVGMALIGAFGFGSGGCALLWANFRRAAPDQNPGTKFSWPMVLGLLATAPLWLILANLLWHDAHPVWACISVLPLLLALNGVRVGCVRYFRRREN